MSDLYRKSEEKHFHYVGGSVMGVPCKRCGATLMWAVPVEPCEHGNYARHVVAGGIVPGDNHNQWHDEYGRVICEASTDG